MQAFDGILADRHTLADGSAEYLHLIFGAPRRDNPSDGLRPANVIDAEFLFLAGKLQFC